MPAVQHPAVTEFISNLDHPLKEEIELLRTIVLNACPGITEKIKWNAPSFCYHGEDRITMRLFPARQLQLVFHRGAGVKEDPGKRLVEDKNGLLTWKTNDRAVCSFTSIAQIREMEGPLKQLVEEWLKTSVD